MTTRFENLEIGKYFFCVYERSTTYQSFGVNAYIKKSLSSAYPVNPITWDRIGDKHNIVNISRAVDVVAIEVIR